MRSRSALKRPTPTRTATYKARLELESLETRVVPAFGLDPAFGLNGVALNPLGGQVRFANLTGLTATPGGKIVAAGNLAGAGGAPTDVAVVRLDASTGAPDASFGGGDGLATFSPGQHHVVTTLTTQADGKILVGGNVGDASVPGGTTSFFVMRLNTDGSLDGSFGRGGEVSLNLGGVNALNGLAVQGDGKLLLAGTATPVPGDQTSAASASNLALARLNADGSVDGTFGSAGGLVTAPASGNWLTAGVGVTANGKIVVGGQFSTAPGGAAAPGSPGDTEFDVYRFNADGSPDQTFSGDGLAQTNYGAFTVAYASSVAVLADGRVVVGGGSGYGQGLLAWFNPDGSLQSQEQLGSAGPGLRWVSEVIALPGGGVEALGYANGGSGLAVERHAAPGSASTFRTVTPAAGDTTTAGLAVLPAGALIAGGLTTPASSASATTFALTRFADPGLTSSPATLVQWATPPETSGTANVALQVVVQPVVGPASVTGGSVTFRDGDRVLGTAPLDDKGLVSLVVSLAPGTHALTADYSGTSSWSAATAPLALRIDAVNPTLSVQVNPGGQVYGDVVTVSGQIQGNGGPAPTGSLTFYDGRTVVGTAPIGPDGAATLMLTGLPAGTHDFRVGYLPAGRTSSLLSADQAFTLGQAQTAVTLTPSTGAPSSGQLLTLSAQVVSLNGLNVASGVKGGTVTFYDNGVAIGTAAVGSGGVASLTTTALRLGSHSVRAVYSGDPNTVGSASPDLKLNVSKAPTSVALALSDRSLGVGAPLTLTATVSTPNPNAFPVGTVTFMDGTRVLGTVRVNGLGQAQFKLASLSPGAHAIEAVFSGNSTCLASTSVAQTATVTADRPATYTSLTTAVGAPVYGQPQTLTARVSVPPGAPTPTGLVNFFDGTTLLGSVQLDGTGAASLTTVLSLGTHQVRAVYLGSNRFAGSASAPTLQTVSKAGTNVTLAATPGTAPLGAPVVLTALVRSPFGTPLSGTVAFMQGTWELGTAQVGASGMASLTLNSLGTGIHPVIAVFSGSNSHLASTSNPFNVTVNGNEIEPPVVPLSGTTTGRAA